MATLKQKKAAKKTLENLRDKKTKSQGEILREAGYSENVSKAPTIVTESKGFKQLLDELIPEELVIDAHKSLLKASRIDHMVFPLAVTDDEIRELLGENGCLVKKIMHSETQTHVWYFAPDGHSRKGGVDMAHKLRGSYAAEKHVHTVTTIGNILDGIENEHKDRPQASGQNVEVELPVQNTEQSGATNTVQKK